MLTVTVPQKAILSFLLAFFLIAGIAVLVYLGVLELAEPQFHYQPLNGHVSDFPQLLEALIFPAIFLTLFLIIFSLFNFKLAFPVASRGHAGLGKKYPCANVPVPPIVSDYAELEELEAEENESAELEELPLDSPIAETPVSIHRQGRGLLLAAEKIIAACDSTPCKAMPACDDTLLGKYESDGQESISAAEEDAPFSLEEIKAIEIVSPFSSMLESFNGSDAKDSDIVELESIPASDAAAMEKNQSIVDSAVLQPFTVQSDNPELLPVAQIHTTSVSDSGEVIFERNGIHYINNSMIEHTQKTMEKINRDFAELVESVTNV